MEPRRNFAGTRKSLAFPVEAILLDYVTDQLVGAGPIVPRAGLVSVGQSRSRTDQKVSRSRLALDLVQILQSRTGA